MKSLLFALFFLPCIQLPAVAQSVISGRVQDQNQSSIPGANVVVKDSYDGASADADGTFSFTTTETGKQKLVITAIGYEPLEYEVDVTSAAGLTLTLRETFNELAAVVISAGSFTAGDEKRRTILKAVDIVTTAGATADIAGALNTLPGTTKVGETGRLFVRGGDDSEARTFIDGMVVLNPYDAAAPNTPTRTRFMPFMFKGTSFSTGGYSSEYGQALSSALILNSKDKAVINQTDIGILSVGGEVAHTQVFQKSSLTAKLEYTDISPYYQLIEQRLDWQDPYASWEGNVAYRRDIGNQGGSLKMYAKYSRADFSYNQPSIIDPSRKQLLSMNNKYGYANVAYNMPLNERWLVRAGLSYTGNSNEITLGDAPLSEQEQGEHLKVVFENSVSQKMEVRFGTEALLRQYQAAQFDTLSREKRNAQFAETITASFGETEVYLSEDVAAKIGARLEHNALTNEWSLDPRVSLAYKPFVRGQFSVAYGTFRQTPKNEYLRISTDLNSERAEHYILNYQVITEKRTFRTEVFYKKYRYLVKYGVDPFQTSNNGAGFAQGAEIFWRDSKTFKSIDYWISYSFLDTKRNYLDYPHEAMPSFASKHNFSAVYKHFITALKSQLGLTYSFASPRPYNNPNTDQFNAGRTPSYHDLSANISYLPKTWIIIYVSCTNLLGRNNVFGYEFSAVPDTSGTYVSRPITQPAKHFMLIGCFITLSKNKGINQLPNL